MNYHDIPGWFNFDDIYRRAVEEAKDGDVFVEIGCWLGRSTAYLAAEIKRSGKRITLHCVDVWEGRITAPQGTPEDPDARQKFEDNMRACGVLDMLTIHQMPSVEAAKLFADKSLAFVFIDGAHDYESVCADLDAWSPKVSDGGILAGHDIDWADVERAVKSRMRYDVLYKSWIKTGMHQRIFIAGYMGIGGGAGVEGKHLCYAFRQAGVEVHWVPMGDPDPDVREELERIGCVMHAYSPDIFRGQVLFTLCDGEVLKRLPEIHAAGKPKAVIFGDCMAKQVYGQDAHKAGLIDYFVFQSGYQRNNHLPELEQIGPVRELVGYRPFFSWTRGAEEGAWTPGCACNKVAGTFNIGRVSRDDYYKYPDRFWGTYQRVDGHGKPVHFWVLGYGENAKNRCGEPPAGENVHVYPPHAISAADLLSHLDVMLHLTGGSGENWPRVLFEAWASGVVPIVDDDHGWRELVTDGADGFRVKSPEEAAEKASLLAQDDALRVQMVKAGYETLLREHCDVERSVAPFRALLEGCPEVTAPEMPKPGKLNLGIVRNVTESLNAICRERPRWMAAHFSVHEGRVHLDRHTHDFPKEDMAAAVELLRADLEREASGEVPKETAGDGQIKNLCICHWGHSRSVCLARLLHGKGHAAVAIGFASNGGAIAPLSAWADRIFVLQADYARYVPAEHAAKIVVMDVGPDVWANPYNPDLRAKLEGMYADYEQRTKPRKLVIALQTYRESPMPQAARDTWIPRARELGFEVLFYAGGGGFNHDDWLAFPAPSEYGPQSPRMEALAKWLAANRPDSWVFRCDDDTFVAPDRLLAFLPTAADYVGWGSETASGGAGMMLSPKAVKVLAENGIPGYWDDVELGKTLLKAGIKLTPDERFRPFCNSDPNDGNEPTAANDYITGHCKTPAKDPYEDRIARMRRFWRETSGRPCVIGVMTHPGSALANTCRETWVPRARELGIEVLFYTGSEKPCCGKSWETSFSGDTLTLPAEPDYAHSCDRMEAFAKWLAQNRPNAWLFGCDDDTLILPDRLLAMLPTAGEYVGYGCDEKYRIGHGGAGVLLSPRAVALLAEKGLPATGHHDIEIGNVMFDNGVAFTHDVRFRPHRNTLATDDNEPTRDNDYVSCHCKSPQNDPVEDRVALMRKLWKECA